MNRHSFPVILLAFLAGTAPLFGLADEKFGPDSTRSHPTTAQSGWPAGLVDLARHDSRVYSVWVNGHEDFHFQANHQSLQQLVDLFSKIRMREHEVRIKPRTPHAKPFNGAPVHYNVKVTFLGGIALGMTPESMDPKTYDTTLTIHLDPETALDTLKKLTVPDNIILHNEIEGSTLKGTATQFAELQTKKPRKNIYVPRYGQRGRSTALHSFPASKLANTKAKAGVVKIPKPTPPE